MKQLVVANRCLGWKFALTGLIALIAMVDLAWGQTDLSQPIVTKDGLGIRRVCVDPLDEIWLVSARDFRCDGDASQLKTFQLVDGCWQPQCIDRVVASHANDKSRATVVFVHGYRTDQIYAESRGLQVYENLLGTQCGKQRPPVRWIIFAWRSECEQLRVLSDFKAKCDRAFGLKGIFADFLDRFTDREMVVAGFSLGSQVVLGGMSQATSQDATKPGQYRVALITPALNPEFTSSELLQFPFRCGIGETAVFINRNDRAVQIANKLLYSDCQRSAGNLRQLASDTGSDVPNPISLFDMTDEVSKRHSINGYTSESKSLQCEVLRMVRTLNVMDFAIRDSDEAAGQVDSGLPGAGKRQPFGLQNETASLR